MSIKYAILGILNWKPTTGYDLKKIFEDSSFLYWSGNNNQIYKALLQMQEKELVTSEVIHQDNSPSKKIYTITEEGRLDLKEWVLSSPEAPEIKKSFLIQFAWSDMLKDDELIDLLDRYENEIRMQLIMQQEKSRRALNSPNRTKRECVIWDMISENLISTYKNELIWVRETKEKLFKNDTIKENKNMNYEIIELNGNKYIEIISTTNPFGTENDALDLIALCWEHEISQLMLHYETLSPEFFQLKTRVAGDMIQKFVNYNIKVAAIIPQDIIQKGRFKELALEMNKGNHFFMCDNKEDAQKWLS